MRNLIKSVVTSSIDLPATFAHADEKKVTCPPDVWRHVPLSMNH